MSTSARDKVLNLDQLREVVGELQGAGRSVALCHGCFDILHSGHLRHLEAARALSDALVVTITPDRHVNKGPRRPVFPEGERAELVAGLSVVDWVAVNQWESAVETIHLLRPTLFVKGQEYKTSVARTTPGFVAEAAAVKAAGGKVAFTYEITSSSTVAFRRLTEGPS
jgi:rfaE bifunctional protein nucleotidyltransferase chain/domain